MPALAHIPRKAPESTRVHPCAGISKIAGFQLPSRGKSPTKVQAAIFYQALNSPQAAAPILGPMCRNTSPPRTGLQDKDEQDVADVSSEGLGIGVDGAEGLAQSCVFSPISTPPDSPPARRSSWSKPAAHCFRSTPRLQYTFGPPLGGDWKQVPREDPTPSKQQAEQEPLAERDAPDTDVKDVASKKLMFKNQMKPRPKIAK